MKKIKFFFGGLALLLTLSLSAQQNNRAESNRLMTLYKKLEGTYQVQVIESREKIAFPLAALDTIEAKRQLNEITYFWLKDNVRVMILPNTTINKKGFVPLTQTAYISSKNLNK